MRLPRNVLYYGREAPLPEQTQLRAGPLSLISEEGDLRYIRLGDREIVRRLYVAVRDRNWGTIPARLSNVQMEVGADSFRITYDVENRQGEIDFAWKGILTGAAEGTITFSMEGEARSTFLKNRIGLCILHPMECAGQPCRVEHEDGTVEESAFPRAISPHQPFLDLRAIAHQVRPGVWAEVRFTGDIFEMEDQRNWTDASYKTYSTPLALPYPVEIRAGTKVAQSVTLTLQGDISRQAAGVGEARLTFSLADASTHPLPRLGLGVASRGQPLTERELMRLRGLNLSHLRVDLNLAQPDIAARLRRAAAESRALGVPLEAALFLSNAAEEELRALLPLLEEARPTVARWLIFHSEERSTTEPWVRLARQYLARYDPEARIGSGTNAYFTHINRERPPVQALDLLCYSLNPQVHAFDNASLVETLAAQAATVESARQFGGGLPIAVSPITLKPRFNPDATGPAREPAPGELPAPVDARQMSLFGAGWTVGSLKYLAESGVASATYYETTGWRGVMEAEDGSPLPEVFRSLPGAVFPLYHVLADLGAFVGGAVVPTAASDALKVDGLAVRKEGRTCVLLANLTAQPQQVRVGNLHTALRVRALDETNAEEAMRAPEAFRAEQGTLLQANGGVLELTLRPYAVARIESA